MEIKIPIVTRTSIPDFVIRKAEVSDVNLILDFIRQLAMYEKMIDDVVAEEKILKEYLFCNKPYAHVVIGEYSKTPVGFALFFTNFSTFLGRPGIYLEDLYVKPVHRGNGFGKSMLTFLARLVVDNDFGRLEWSVLNWNEPAINFYKKLGAISMDEWKIFRLSGKEILTLI